MLNLLSNLHGKKDVVRKITYKNTWPGVIHKTKGEEYSYRPVSIEIRVINGKMEDVIINGKHFILDLNHVENNKCLARPGVG